MPLSRMSLKKLDLKSNIMSYLLTCFVAVCVNLSALLHKLTPPPLSVTSQLAPTNQTV